MINVVIIDDHPVVRAGMKAVLDAVENITVVAAGGSGAKALLLVSQHAPDVLVLDVNLPDINGIEITRQLHAGGTTTAVLILTAHDDPEIIFELLNNGAIGYVLKDEALETLAHAVRAAARGESWLSPTIASEVVQRAIQRNGRRTANLELPLPTQSPLTPREMEVLKLLAWGLDNKAIALELVVTKRTVQNHISNIYSKLSVASRTEAMLFAIRQGWVNPQGD